MAGPAARFIVVLSATALLATNLSCSTTSPGHQATCKPKERGVSYSPLGSPPGSPPGHNPADPGKDNMNEYVDGWTLESDENSSPGTGRERARPAPDPPDTTGDYINGWTFPAPPGTPGPENPGRVRKPLPPPSPNHNTRDYIDGWTDQPADQQ